MKSDIYYFVFRYYNAIERPHSTPDNRLAFYGWSQDKKIIKIFMSQRSPEKYKVVKKYKDSVPEAVLESWIDMATMIDYVTLPSVSTGDDVTLFITKQEMAEVEIRLQKYFKDLPKLIEMADGKITLLRMYHNLRDKYIDMLGILGYKPNELNVLYDDSVTEYDTESSIKSLYENYAAEIVSDDCRKIKHDEIPGRDWSCSDEISEKIIYSIESFVKILKDDL